MDNNNRQQRNHRKILKGNIGHTENKTQYPVSIISDEEALRIHGLSFENDGYSTDSGKSSFDEEYFKYKPQPLQVTKNNTVTINSVNVPNEGKLQEEKDDYSCNGFMKKGISSRRKLSSSESTLEKQVLNKRDIDRQQSQFRNTNNAAIPIQPYLFGQSRTKNSNGVLSTMNLPTNVKASNSISLPVKDIRTHTTSYDQITKSRNKYVPEISCQNSTINTDNYNSSSNRHLNIHSTNRSATHSVPNWTSTNIPVTANNRVLSVKKLSTDVTASGNNSLPVTHIRSPATSYDQVTRSRNKYIPETSYQDSTINTSNYNSPSNRHLKNIPSTNRPVTQNVPNHISTSVRQVSASPNISSVSETIHRPGEFSDTNNLLEEEETSYCCCQ